MHTDMCYFLSPHKKRIPTAERVWWMGVPSIHSSEFLFQEPITEVTWNVNQFVFFFNCSPKFLPCPSSKLVHCGEPRFSADRACPTFWWNVLFECVTETRSFLETRIWWLSRRGLLGWSSIGTNPTGDGAWSHLQPKVSHEEMSGFPLTFHGSYRGGGFDGAEREEGRHGKREEQILNAWEWFRISRKKSKFFFFWNSDLWNTGNIIYYFKMLYIMNKNIYGY